jgi:hypothetical protein
MYLQVSEKVIYGLSCVALYIIYTIYSKYIYLKQQDTLDHIYTSLKQTIKNYLKNYEYRNVFYFELLEMAFKLHKYFLQK